MREIWKEIVDYEGLYAVSNLGRVKRLKTDKKNGTGNYARNEHIVSQQQNNKGYYSVSLYKNNIRKQLLVHRIVATAFIANANNYPIVNHIDENIKNNSVENLEWCTQKYNMNYGSCAKRIGLKNSKKIKQLDFNLNIINIFNSSMEAQRILGISNGCINECCNGKRKSAGGFIWQFVK